MHNFHDQFLFNSFLSALHVSNESSRSSSGARHDILCYTAQSVQSRRRIQLLAGRLLSLTVPTVLCNTVYHAVLLIMND